LIGIIMAAPAGAETITLEDGTQAVMEVVVDDLGVPWGMAFLSGNELIFTEREGNIGLLELSNGHITELSGAPDVWASGQGGMLDVAVAPEYEPGDWIYFTYAKNVSGQGVTVLARARRAGTELQEWTELLVTRSASATGRHFGSRIAFGSDDFLYFSVGDRGVRDNGQNLATHAGTILRLHRDGQVPRDNPFVARVDALPEIWSYGHRNVQGLVYDRGTDRLWAIEHGPRGGDELNLIVGGQNYGWPIISHGREYWGPVKVGEATSRPGYADPLKVYIPSIAPGSLVFYQHEAFPGWKGNLLAGALKLRHINRIVLSEAGQSVDEQRLLKNFEQRIRALAINAEGHLYFSTDSGLICRIKPLE
jgi:glucose/arabinose dehydrogenase